MPVRLSRVSPEDDRVIEIEHGARHSCLRGGHRNLTNPWCFGPQGLPTTLNISTNIVLYLAIASSLCNLAISDSSQNIVKNYSIRVSTKIQPHFLAQILENSQP